MYKSPKSTGQKYAKRPKTQEFRKKTAPTTMRDRKMYGQEGKKLTKRCLMLQ
jgi:hypothetical protein